MQESYVHCHFCHATTRLEKPGPIKCPACGTRVPKFTLRETLILQWGAIGIAAIFLLLLYLFTG